MAPGQHFLCWTLLSSLLGWNCIVSMWNILHPCYMHQAPQILYIRIPVISDVRSWRSTGRKHLNLHIFSSPWGREKCAVLFLVSHHTKLRIGNSLSHCFFLGETDTAKIDLNYKNLEWQITQDLFVLGKSISKLEQAVSLAGVVFQHGRALGLLMQNMEVTAWPWGNLLFLYQLLRNYQE